MNRNYFYLIILISSIFPSCNIDMIEKGKKSMLDPRVPEINVKQGNDNIPSETGSFSIDGVLINETSITYMFSIENLGTADLNLTGNPIVNITGDNSALYNIVSQPSSSVINPGRSETFSVAFTPDSIGEKTAFVNIETDDFDEPLYFFILEGNPAPEPDFFARLRKGTIPLTVAFTDSSLGNISTLDWDFGDGTFITTAPGGTVEHTYTVDGSFTVILTASGASGSNFKVKSNYVLSTKAVKTVVDNYFDRACSVFADDINSDGYQDIVAAGFYYSTTAPLSIYSEIAWYKNNGSGDFSKYFIGSASGNPASVITADIDGDDINDVAVASSSTIKGTEVAWWKNDVTGTTKTFGLKNTVATEGTFAGANSIAAYDIDNDTDVDLIVSRSKVSGGFPPTYYGVVRIFSNNVDGSSWTDIDVKTGFYGVSQVAIADIDSDLDQDIIAVNTEDTIPVTWWENGNSWAEATIPGTEHVTQIYILDFNGDGHVDILSASPYNGSSDIDIWLNNEDGTSWTKQSVATGYTEVLKVAAEDMNLDLKTDIIAGSSYYGISWWPADPVVNLTYPVKYIADNQFLPSSVTTADVDGNGYPDIIASNDSTDEIAWWDLKFDGWYKTEVDTLFSAGDYTSAADLDNDGDLDILGSSGSSGEISWWENGGYGEFPKKHLLDDSVNFNEELSSSYESNFYTSDIDGDGDIDILAAACFGNEIVFWENLSNGSFSEQQVFASYDGTGNYTNSVITADIDDDGDQDIITGAEGLVDLWIAAPSSGEMSWERIPLQVEQTNYAYNLSAADIDGDTDIDIVGIGEDPQTNHVWWRNPLIGSNSEWERNIINTSQRINEARICDIDADGDIEIVCIYYYGDLLFKFENDGSGVFTYVLIDNTIELKTLLVNDIDGDSDNDIIASPISYPSFYIYENNDNNGSFTKKILTSAPKEAYRIVDTDIDNDGDTDILGVFQENNEISIWENNISAYGGN